MRPRTFRFIVVVLFTHGLAHAAEAPPKKTVAEVIPITAANLHGQQSLYREGWFVVTSTEKTLSYAKEHGVTSAGQAVSRAVAAIGEHGSGLGTRLAAAGQSGMETTEQVAAAGAAQRQKQWAATDKLTHSEMDYGSRAMARAWEHLIQGNLTLAARTAEDRRALQAIPGDWFAQLKADYSNLHELSEKAKARMSSHIEGNWDQAFHEAQLAFDQSYQASGTRHNSLSALGDIMGGYAKAAYSGVAKPAARSTVQGAEATAKVGGKIIFLPVVGLPILAERTVASAGQTLYYVGDMGVKLVSPTVESGLLTGLALFSYGAVPATYLAGGSAGVVNQVALTAAAPVAGAGKAVATGAGETVQYAARVSYDLGRGVTTVALNETQAGIALGYNALTQLPTQTLLGAANGAIFLVYDGPRLVLASARGEVQWQDETGAKGSVPVESVPVGSVVDLAALKARGAAVEVIDADPETIHKVLKNLPQDLRAGGQP